MTKDTYDKTNKVIKLQRNLVILKSTQPSRLIPLRSRETIQTVVDVYYLIITRDLATNCV